MRKLIIINIALPFFLSIVLFSCTNNLPDVNQMRQICFVTEVLPIFKSNCAISGCHPQGSEIPLYNYTSIMYQIDSGNPDNSEAYQVIISKWINAMPPDKALTEDARTTIRIWIEQGAKNVNCNDSIQ
jgi:hypothetical protein